MNKSFNQNRSGSGTREWSDRSYNIAHGCSHGCLYCYARSFKARFDADVRQPGGWENQRLRAGSSLGSDVRGAGVVMFPTAHDLTPAILPETVATIQNLLAGGNDLLIVAKPHLEVIKRLCDEFAGDRERILFRFSIGTLNAGLCEYWEPSAPAPEERLQSLEHAFDSGFATSVSMEPMLDSVDATVELVATVEPFVTDTIWIGKMQRIPQKLNSHVLGFTEACVKIKAQQRDEEILRLVDALKGNEKVQWKDSIKKVIARSVGQNSEEAI
jgi:DNA repair photolyase